MDVFEGKLDLLIDQLIGWAPKVLGAILALIIGFWVIGGIMKMVRRGLANSGLGEDVIPFLSSMISVLFKVLLLVAVAGMVGIETTSFIALIGMAGLAIGMALQGTLGHFASGIMILIFKPYKAGDLVDVQGQLGHVEEIQVFNTIIKTLDNKRSIVPNGVATSGVITNLSSHQMLRVDLNVAMPYEESFERVQELIQETLSNVPKVVSDPAPVVEIEKFDAHNILLAVRPYATPEDYWDVYFGAYKAVKAALGKNNIRVAYPRTDVQMMSAS